MEFEMNNSLFFSDTNIPDVFITDYLPMMPPEQVKLYIYLIFLTNKNKKIKLDDLSAKMSMSRKQLDELLICLEAIGLIQLDANKVKLQDIKEKEFLKLYAPKNNVKFDQAIKNTKKKEEQNQVVAMINNRFFQGLMSPQWFVDIDSWFEKFGFEIDVMYALFQQAYESKKFNRSYIFAVAQAWAVAGIKNSEQLEKYITLRKEYLDIEKKVAKKLRKQTPQGFYALNEYEAEYLKKWVVDYGFKYDVIEYMLKRCLTKKMNIGFNYLDAIMTEWNKAEAVTLDEVKLYEQHSAKNRQQATKTSKKGVVASAAQGNFEKLGYDKEFMDNLIEKL